jgi:glycosyltransferase involved in cell wall biosynthesis
MLAVEVLQRLVEKSNFEFHLVMAGDGELMNTVKGFVNDSSLPVTFMGWVSDVAPLLIAADLLLMTSKNEGMPVAIIEAASAGVSTVSTRVGGVHEFVIQEETGFLADQSVDSISSAILNAICKFDLTLAGERAHLKYLKEFSEDIFIRKHIDLYQNSI